MSKMQRYTHIGEWGGRDGMKDDSGEWVRYEDHMKAINQCSSIAAETLELSLMDVDEAMGVLDVVVMHLRVIKRNLDSVPDDYNGYSAEALERTYLALEAINK